MSLNKCKCGCGATTRGEYKRSCRPRKNPTARFWVKVRKRTTGKKCWEWTGATSKETGYGAFNDGKGRTVGAHVFSYRSIQGPIKKGLVVMHACDNRICVRPEHLSLGTPADNNADMANKGRARSAPKRGAEHYRSKLTADKVRAARALHKQGRKVEWLAKFYRVAKSTMHSALTRKTWAHIE